MISVIFLDLAESLVTCTFRHWRVVIYDLSHDPDVIQQPYKKWQMNVPTLDVDYA